MTLKEEKDNERKMRRDGVGGKMSGVGPFAAVVFYAST